MPVEVPVILKQQHGTVVNIRNHIKSYEDYGKGPNFVGRDSSSCGYVYCFLHFPQPNDKFDRSARITSVNDMIKIW